MRKFLSLLLVLAMCLTACGTKDTKDKDDIGNLPTNSVGDVEVDEDFASGDVDADLDPDYSVDEEFDPQTYWTEHFEEAFDFSHSLLSAEYEENDVKVIMEIGFDGEDNIIGITVGDVGMILTTVSGQSYLNISALEGWVQLEGGVDEETSSETIGVNDFSTLSETIGDFTYSDTYEDFDYFTATLDGESVKFVMDRTINKCIQIQTGDYVMAITDMPGRITPPSAEEISEVITDPDEMAEAILGAMFYVMFSSYADEDGNIDFSGSFEWEGEESESEEEEVITYGTTN